MRAVLTLVGNDRQPLDRRLLDRAADALPDRRGETPLDSQAIELFFESDDLGRVERDVREALGSAAVDLAVLPAAGREKKLLLADMDSTIITVECIDELADYAGAKAAVAAITERAMQGEIGFEGALTERVALLQGLPESVLQQCFDERVRLSPGAATLVRTMKARGAYAALVSGGFTFFTGRIARLCGFDEHRANTLLFEGGRLTGKVARPILGREAKLATLRELTQRLGIDPAEALVVGDGANDLGMIEAAGLGVAYRAKPVTARAARARIDHGDLTALLAFQGISRPAL